MRKMLIISDSLFGKVLAAVIEKEGFDVILSSHEDSVFTVASEDPSHIFICECDKGMTGEKTFLNLGMSISDQVIYRCGFSDGKGDDYFQLPLNLDNLKSKIKK